MKLNIVFSMKAKPHINNVFPEVSLLIKINDVSIKKI